MQKSNAAAAAAAIDINPARAGKRTKISVYQLLLHALFIVIVILTIAPIVLVLSISLTDENAIYAHGYSFFPTKFSFAAYTYLFRDGGVVVHAYGISIVATVIGSVAGLLMTALFAYPISKQDFPLRNWFSFYVFFTILFNGGLVPWYLVYTNFINVKDSLWGLIVPNLLMNGFNILIVRTFFRTLPSSLMESAKIDGAGEFRIWLQIVMPLSLPVLATIGLFNTLGYWNDWFNSLIFISDEKWYSLQYLMQRTLQNVQFLSQHSGSGSLSSLLAAMPTEAMRMAMAITGVGPIVLAYPFFQRYLIQGLTIGAVKG